jgi:hypothetical protein
MAAGRSSNVASIMTQADLAQASRQISQQIRMQVNLFLYIHYMHKYMCIETQAILLSAR